MSGDDESQDALADWEEGSAFGVSEDKDPLCTTPVRGVLDLPVESTVDVPIPEGSSTRSGQMPPRSLSERQPSGGDTSSWSANPAPGSPC